MGFITGSAAYPGAALLGIAGAQATSVGMVRYFGEPRVQDLVLLAAPEVVVSERWTSKVPVQAWVVGSGVPRDDIQLESIRACLEAADVAVIDAGALSLLGSLEFAADSNHLITPHQGELCALLNRIDVPAPRGGIWHPELLDAEDEAWNAAAIAAEVLGCTVLLKGSVTRIVAPNGERVAAGPNSSALATAGTGDVLAGVLGGIAAQNPEVAKRNWLDIAKLAVELHSEAAQLAGAEGAVTASAVAKNIYAAINQRRTK